MEEKMRMVDEKLRELGVDESDSPGFYTEGQYDAVLLYHPKDRDKAHVLKDELESLESTPRVCTEDDSCLYYTSVLKKREECFKKSTYMLLYVTANFNEEFECELLKEHAISEMLDNPDKRWCVIPIASFRTMQHNKLPFGLRGIKPLEIVDDPDPSKHTSDVEYFEKFSKRNLTKMFNDKKSLKKKRQLIDEHEFKKWKIKKLKEEITKQHQAAAEIQAEESNLADRLNNLSCSNNKTKKGNSDTCPTASGQSQSVTNPSGNSNTTIINYHINGKMVQIGDNNQINIVEEDDNDSEDSSSEEDSDELPDVDVPQSTTLKLVVDCDTTVPKTLH